jgi:hypothetical protein
MRCDVRWAFWGGLLAVAACGGRLEQTTFADAASLESGGEGRCSPATAKSPRPAGFPIPGTLMLPSSSAPAFNHLPMSRRSTPSCTLQHHRHGALQDLVLEGWDADGPCFCPRSPSGCGPAARAVPGTCPTSRGSAATGGCPPAAPRTAPRSPGPRPSPRPCACAETPRKASRCL